MGNIKYYLGLIYSFNYTFFKKLCFYSFLSVMLYGFFTCLGGYIMFFIWIYMAGSYKMPDSSYNMFIISPLISIFIVGLIYILKKRIQSIKLYLEKCEQHYRSVAK